MIKEKVKQRIKFSMIMIVIAVAIAFAIFTVLKYDVEGEKEVPFNIKKIIIISSASVSDVPQEEQNVNMEEQTTEAEGQTGEEQQIEDVSSNEQQATSTETVEASTENNTEEVTQPVEEGNEEASAETVENTAEQQGELNSEETVAEEEHYIWEKNVIQTNDICIVLDKNQDFKEQQIIKSVKIENIQILQNVNIGKIQVYMPNSLDDEMYKYTNDFLVNSTLTYTGAASDNKKALQIGNKGGCVYINFSNVGLDAYKSNENQEIKQGAFILEKMNLTNEDLKFKISFDLIIEVQDKSYKTNIVLDLPVEDLVGNKETHKEITDFKDTIFKRL